MTDNTTHRCSCGTCKACYMREYRLRPHAAKAEVIRSRSWYVRTKAGGEVVAFCEWCERSFFCTRRAHEGHNRRYCGRACKDSHRNALLQFRRQASKPTRSCRHCGSAMPQAMRADAAFCSAECNSNAHSQTRKASRKIGARQQRVDRAYIVERDGGRCHLCGGKPQGTDLTIDHVIPLAKGGSHTSENLRVACLSCNCAKGARPANDQLLLVG